MAPIVEVTGFETGKPVFYTLKVNKNDGTQAYTLKKRFNDFITLAKEAEDELGEPLAVAPPPKPKFYESVDCNARQRQLEVMLQANLKSPEFAKSFAIGKFLELYTTKQQPPNSTVDWIGTCRKITNEFASARQTEGPKLRQHVVQIKSYIGQLQRSNNEQSSSTISEERARRQQQLDAFLKQISELERKALIKPRQVEDTPRVLGETSQTVNLDSSELKQQQELVMENQDLAIDDILATIRRQKELGLAINDEITSQTELLNGLEDDVNKVNAKLNYARKKTERMNK